MIIFIPSWQLSLTFLAIAVFDSAYLSDDCPHRLQEYLSSFKKSEKKLSCCDWCGLWLFRLFINFVVVALLAGSTYLVWYISYTQSLKVGALLLASVATINEQPAKCVPNLGWDETIWCDKNRGNPWAYLWLLLISDWRDTAWRTSNAFVYNCYQLYPSVCFLHHGHIWKIRKSAGWTLSHHAQVPFLCVMTSFGAFSLLFRSSYLFQSFLVSSGDSWEEGKIFP